MPDTTERLIGAFFTGCRIGIGRIAGAPSFFVAIGVKLYDRSRRLFAPSGDRGQDIEQRLAPGGGLCLGRGAEDGDKTSVRARYGNGKEGDVLDLLPAFLGAHIFSHRVVNLSLRSNGGVDGRGERQTSIGAVKAIHHFYPLFVLLAHKLFLSQFLVDLKVIEMKGNFLVCSGQIYRIALG